MEGSPEGTKKADTALRLSSEAYEMNRRLARYFGTTQSKITEVAHSLFIDHLDGVDVIKVPELVSSVADLEETVGRLIVHMEYLERLAYELAGLEADRIK
jgi:hypothetical protein